MKSFVSLALALVLAVCQIGGIQAGSVTSSSCPDVVTIGNFVDLDIPGCPPTDGCVKPANVFEGFTLIFSPSSNDIEPWLRLTVTGRSYVGSSEVQTIGFRQLDGELFTLVPGLFKFPRLGTEVNGFDVRFILESSAGIEVCRTLVMTVVEVGAVQMEGSAVGDVCPNVTPGEPCGFRGSECVVQNGEKVCLCDRQSEQVYMNGVSVCHKRTGWKCSSDFECSSNAVCAVAGTERACRCAAEAFPSTNGGCIRNGGAELGDPCEHPKIPCAFDHSMCAEDQVCVCNEDATVDGDTWSCKLVPGKEGECGSDKDCVANAACALAEDGLMKCACRPGYAAEVTGCVAYNIESSSVGAACQKPLVSCGFENSICEADNKCACDAGFVPVGSTCGRPFGASCGIGGECGDNAYCGRDESGEDHCMCLNGFVSSASNGGCIKAEGAGINATCSVLGGQCLFPNSICKGGGDEPLICGCSDGTLEQRSQCRVKASMSCTTDAECVDAAICAEIQPDGQGKCTCVGGEDVETPEGACSTNAETGCSPDTNCGPNAYCSLDQDGKDKCFCNQGFENSISDGTCVKVVGTSIGAACSTSGAQCEFPNSVCAGAAGSLFCGCTSDALDQTGQCRVKARKACTSDPDCVAGAYCFNIGPDGNGMCVCREEGAETPEGACRTDADVGCSSGTSCGLNSYCSVDQNGQDKCFCLDGFEKSISDGACVKVEGTAIDDSCKVRGAQCLFPNSMCDGTASLYCGCTFDAIQQKNQCRIKASRPCKSNPDCVDGAVCRYVGQDQFGVCNCVEGETETEDGACSSTDTSGANGVGLYSSLLVMALVTLSFKKLF